MMLCEELDDKLINGNENYMLKYHNVIHQYLC